MARPDASPAAPPRPLRRPPALDPADAGVESNARLTGSTAAVLLVLLACEGVTILQIQPLLDAHVFIGMLLIPPVVLKIGSTSFRFARYYLGAPAYRRKGPPAPLLRLLGPFVVILSVLVLGSGVALLVTPVSLRSNLLLLHKATFVLWFGAMAIHVIGHILETAKLAPRDYYWRTRRQVASAGLRQWTIAATLGIGVVLGALLIPKVAPYLASIHR